jgi:hypothetical protein
VTADFQGNIYTLWNSGSREGAGRHAHDLALHAPDGSEKHPSLIESQFNILNSPRVDPSGNIYLAIAGRPAGIKIPEGLQAEFGKGGLPWDKNLASPELDWYPLLYGCIVKFGPEGGMVRNGIGGTPIEFSWPGQKGVTAEIKGAQWIHFGASPVVSWRHGPPDTCFCESPRFDVDRYGRVFYPDAARFRVGMLDTAGNALGAFGSYGNPDSAGPGSAIPEPRIPMFWPYVIEAGEDVIYVGDRLNRRVVVVKLAHAAEAVCAIP